MSPPSRPRRGLLGVAAASAAAALVAGVIVLGGETPVEASGLARFSSCAELSEWGQEYSSRESFDIAGAPLTTMAAAAPSAAMEESDAAAAGDGAVSARAEESVATQAPEGDGTNVVVEGVDEPDLVERLGGDRALVVGGSTLAVADLGDAELVARATVPWGAQVTYDADAGVAWSVGTMERGAVQVQRFVVAESSLTPDGTWSADGSLVSARRQGGELLVVATDWFDSPVVYEEPLPDVGVEPLPGVEDPDRSVSTGVDPTDGVGGSDGSTSQDSLPFAGAPVPCDQVLYPAGPAEPSATLLAVLPVSGPLEPVRATEVVGSGSLVHVTADAAFLATPTWDAGTGAQSTGLHRFDLASLTHTGSGLVEGALLNDFSMSAHDGHLRVAVSLGGGFVGRPMPIEGDGGIGSAAAGGDVVFESSKTTIGEAVSPSEPDAAEAQDVATVGGTIAAEIPSDPQPDLPAPETTVPERPEPEPTGPEPTDPGSPVTETTVPVTTVPETTVPETTMVEPFPEIPPMPELPVPDPGEPLNEIVVLDTDGALDVIGRTPRFGLPGETLYGIRFDGATAYAVTFLQTDPFYVIDLTDPTAPRVAGELKLPGFSAYLHPVSATEVVGFGPDESGRVSAKLFNVSDPAAPMLIDSIVLGDQSPVVYDHHAFVDLGGGRFAVPASSWGGLVDSPVGGPAEICGVAGCDGSDYGQPYSVPSEVVVLAISGGRLAVEDRVPVDAVEPVSRVIPFQGGWGALAGTQLHVVDDNGTERANLPLG